MKKLTWQSVRALWCSNRADDCFHTPPGLYKPTLKNNCAVSKTDPRMKQISQLEFPVFTIIKTSTVY